jgi:hypothetical protein
MSKFGSGVNVNETFKVEIIDPATDLPLVDVNGATAFVEVLSTDSDVGRQFDKTRRKVGMQRAVRTAGNALAQDDPVEENQEKLAKLTRSWHLVDVATLEPIEVPCSETNALELYRDGGMQWLYRQVWLGASAPANFIRKGSRPSSPSSSGKPDSTASAPTGQAS